MMNIRQIKDCLTEIAEKAYDMTKEKFICDGMPIELELPHSVTVTAAKHDNVIAIRAEGGGHVTHDELHCFDYAKIAYVQVGEDKLTLPDMLRRVAIGAAKSALLLEEGKTHLEWGEYIKECLTNEIEEILRREFEDPVPRIGTVSKYEIETGENDKILLITCRATETKETVTYSYISAGKSSIPDACFVSLKAVSAISKTIAGELAANLDLKGDIET